MINVGIFQKILSNTKLLLVSILVVATSVSAVLPAATLAAPGAAKENACKGLGGNFNDKEGTCNTGGTSVEDVIKAILNILSVVAGAIAVIMIIVGGIKYVTSAGDSNATSSAKNTIIFALVGLIIVALAQAIVQFVLKGVLG